MAFRADDLLSRISWGTISSHEAQSISQPKTASQFGSRERYFGIVVFMAFFVAMSTMTRAGLAIRAADKITIDWTLGAAFLIGLLYDLIAGGLAAIPVALYVMLVPQRIWASRLHRILMYGVGFAGAYALVVLAAAEWFFWTEFQVRFNFIAVDYLVYTEEILGNIRESYPTGPIFAGLAVVTCIVWFLLTRTKLATAWLHSQTGLRARILALTVVLVAPSAVVSVVEQSDIPGFANNYNRELAKNGLFSLFAAFNVNHLEYTRFFTTIDRAAVFDRLHVLLAETDATPVLSTNDSVLRQISGAMGKEKHYNVIQITVESLSASFMSRFGNQHGLTPNLDKLAADGLLFTNFYATGTRTTRGMEALSLSLPPTPGRSIIHRPNSDHLFTLGSVFRSRGYDTAFLYGGYGYFDHMNRFFSSNGYRIVDRNAMAASDVTFATIWGACDEDLLRWTMAEADRDFEAGTPFHFFVMTTSNHRPYTYPEGRIDIPSKTGRDGAVKYTDYAIGKFINDARSRPWFANTIFVIVADHCASSAGKAELTVPKYHIPLIFYNPGLVSQGEISTLSSQVDFAPTLLGLLGWSYDSRFFGHNLFAQTLSYNKALIGNYQTLGLLTENRLQILKPKQEDHIFEVDRASGELETLPKDRELERDAVAYYQGASILYVEGRYSELDYGN